MLFSPLLLCRPGRELRWLPTSLHADVQFRSKPTVQFGPYLLIAVVVVCRLLLLTMVLFGLISVPLSSQLNAKFGHHPLFVDIPITQFGHYPSCCRYNRLSNIAHHTTRLSTLSFVQNWPSHVLLSILSLVQIGISHASLQRLHIIYSNHPTGRYQEPRFSN